MTACLYDLDSAAWDARKHEERLVMAGKLPVPPPDLVHSVAHDLMTSRDAIGHVSRHISEAQAKAATPADAAFELNHASSHTDELIVHLDSAIGGLKRLHPAIGREIDLLRAAMRTSDVSDAPREALPRTCAHVLMTARVAAGHVRRHVTAAQDDITPVSLRFDLAHAAGHVEQVTVHLDKEIDGLKRLGSPVSREIDALDKASGFPTGRNLTGYEGLTYLRARPPGEDDL